MSNQKLPPWSGIKAGLQDLDGKELIKIIRDLYQLSKENKIFLASRMGDVFYNEYPDEQKE